MIDEILREREKTHGEWQRQAELAHSLKRCVDLAQAGPAPELSPGQQEAIEMILVKISRIVCGNPNEEDHYLDIIGYATLGKNSKPL